jgi:hypothetical protein
MWRRRGGRTGIGCGGVELDIEVRQVRPVRTAGRRCAPHSIRALIRPCCAWARRGDGAHGCRPRRQKGTDRAHPSTTAPLVTDRGHSARAADHAGEPQPRSPSSRAARRRAAGARNPGRPRRARRSCPRTKRTMRAGSCAPAVSGRDAPVFRLRVVGPGRTVAARPPPSRPRPPRGAVHVLPIPSVHQPHPGADGARRTSARGARRGARGLCSRMRRDRAPGRARAGAR